MSLITNISLRNSISHGMLRPFKTYKNIKNLINFPWKAMMKKKTQTYKLSWEPNETPTLLALEGKTTRAGRSNSPLLMTHSFWQYIRLYET